MKSKHSKLLSNLWIAVNEQKVIIQASYELRERQLRFYISRRMISRACAIPC